jgi:hypothetical protein
MCEDQKSCICIGSFDPLVGRNQLQRFAKSLQYASGMVIMVCTPKSVEPDTLLKCSKITPKHPNYVIIIFFLPGP